MLATNYPQLRLEPLLRREAEKRAPGSIRYHHEVLDWQQTDAGVVASVRDRDTGDEFTVRARYVIAADGGKTVGPREGVQMVGPTSMVDMVSTHFTADLSQYWDDKTLITWFLNPEGENSWGAGAMVQMGPTWGRHSEEWVVHFAFRPDDPERFHEEAIIPRLRELLRLPELELTVHKVSHWILDRIVADRWRVGNIFLAGDAAHRQPPTTGLGLNTGILDAHNLTWKLAQVLCGSATDALLDSYESERKPVSTDGADWALMTFGNHTVIDAGIGLTPGAPLEVNTAAFHALFADGLLGDALRARAAETIGTQRFEFQAHDVEIGYHYHQGALVPDGSEAPPRSSTGTIYTPTSRPGHRLPHAWLEQRRHPPIDPRHHRRRRCLRPDHRLRRRQLDQRRGDRGREVRHPNQRGTDRGGLYRSGRRLGPGGTDRRAWRCARPARQPCRLAQHRRSRSARTHAHPGHRSDSWPSLTAALARWRRPA